MTLMLYLYYRENKGLFNLAKLHQFVQEIYFATIYSHFNIAKKLHTCQQVETNQNISQEENQFSEKMSSPVYQTVSITSF